MNLINNYGWFFKYKIYHIPFWLVYHVVWWWITIGSLSDVFYSIFALDYTSKFLFAVIFQAVGVYFNLYFLIPKFLKKRKYVSYFLWVIFSIVVTAVLTTSGYYFGAYLSDLSFEQLYDIAPSNWRYILTSRSLPSAAASMTLGMSLKLTKNWIQAERKQQELEKEKLETELKYLKSQFNPHFLFNTINSIFVLIHKNQDMASDSLAKFSDLLRYQLYECNEHFIPLKRELSYLKGFIELSGLRLNPKEVELSVSLPEGAEEGLQIAPFILMPFIENAFKHVKKGQKEGGVIEMHLEIIEEQLSFTVKNTKALNVNELGSSKGLGLKNVKRRLALIYPEKHELEIEEDSDWYSVKLQLDLKQNGLTIT